MQAVIVGCGTIGLALGVALSSRGQNVILFDRDANKLEAISNQSFDAGELEMTEALHRGLQNRTIILSNALPHDVGGSTYIICIPTPTADIGELISVVQQIAARATPNDAILIRSTVAIGSTRKLHSSASTLAGKSLLFASTPDRSVEGQTFSDQFSIPHLIGGMSEAASDRATALFSILGRSLSLNNPEEAEAAKIFSNTWRAGMFAMVNAMALIADDHALDLHAINAAASTDYPRFSPPRPGLIGGPCLPKDISLLIESENPASTAFFDGVRRSEFELERRIKRLALDQITTWPIRPLNVAFLGLAFKGSPAVTDMRGSPALALARDLGTCEPDIHLKGWDPSPVDASATGISMHASALEAAADCALVVLGHNHPAIIGLDLDELALRLPKQSLIVDLTGLAKRPSNPSTPIRYWSIGRKNV